MSILHAIRKTLGDSVGKNNIIVSLRTKRRAEKKNEYILRKTRPSSTAGGGDERSVSPRHISAAVWGVEEKALFFFSYFFFVYILYIYFHRIIIIIIRRAPDHPVRWRVRRAGIYRPAIIHSYTAARVYHRACKTLRAHGVTLLYRVARPIGRGLRRTSGGNELLFLWRRICSASRRGVVFAEHPADPSATATARAAPH